MSAIKNYYFDGINGNDEYPDDTDSDYVESDWSIENDVIEYTKARTKFSSDKEFWTWHTWHSQQNDSRLEYQRNNEE